MNAIENLRAIAKYQREEANQDPCAESAKMSRDYAAQCEREAGIMEESQNVQ